MAKSKKNVKKGWDNFVTMMLVLAASVFGWTTYQIINHGLADVLRGFGLENFYLQGFIILAVLGLLLTKFGGKKIDELLG